MLSSFILCIMISGVARKEAMFKIISCCYFWVACSFQFGIPDHRMWLFGGTSCNHFKFDSLMSIWIFCICLTITYPFFFSSWKTFQLQDKAGLTLTCLDKCKDGGFEELFLTKIDYPANYDYCMRYSLFVWCLVLLFDVL